MSEGEWVSVVCPGAQEEEGAGQGDPREGGTSGEVAADGRGGEQQ